MNLSSFCLRNFKAVQNSKSIRFSPLTVFIGNNGSEKSSIVEAMETFQSIVLKGLDEAMASWYGFEYILNKAKEHKTIKDKVSSPITFTFHGKSEDERLKFHLEVAADSTFNRIYFQDYKAAYHFGELAPMNKFISKGEIKDPKLSEIPSFCGSIRDHNMSTKVMVASFDAGVLKEFRLVCPEVATSAGFTEAFLFYFLQKIRMESVYSPDMQAMQIPETRDNRQVVNRRFVEAAHARNMRVHVWTINDIESMKQYLKLGVDGIMTDYPDRLIKLLKISIKANYSEN